MTHTQRFSNPARCLLAACVMVACVPVWAATPQPFRAATAYYSQGGYPITNALNATYNSGWANGESKVYMTNANQMPTTLGWLTEETSVNNIAVFSLADAMAVTADDALWFNLDFLASNSHSISKIRLYVTDSTTVGDGDINAYLSKTNQSAMQSKLGAANIWTPVDAYLSTTTLKGSVLNADGVYVTNMTGGNGGSEAYYLYAAMPDGISSIGAVKLEVLMEGPDTAPTRGPGNYSNKNYILSEFQFGTPSANIVDTSLKSAAVGFSNAVNDISIIKNGDGTTCTYFHPESNRSGFGYDFNGMRTVDEITFYQPPYSDGNPRMQLEEITVHTTQGAKTYQVTPEADTGKVTLTLDTPIDTSYVFITPTKITGTGDSRIGIASLEVSGGDYQQWTNVALGKSVIDSGGHFYQPNTGVLTDGVTTIFTDGGVDP